LPQILVVVRYDIVTAGEYWVSGKQVPVVLQARKSANHVLTSGCIRTMRGDAGSSRWVSFSRDV
jgi:hypothetical protein